MNQFPQASVIDPDFDGDPDAVLERLLLELEATGSIARGIDVLPCFDNGEQHHPSAMGRPAIGWLYRRARLELLAMGGLT